MRYSDKLLNTVSPSQWVNIIWIILGIGLVKTIIVPLYALVRVLDIYYWRYEFRERTIIERRGILNISRKEVHYYRIKSIKIDEPFWMRIFGLANLSVMTSDPYQPELVLYAVPRGLRLKDSIRENTHYWRKSEGVREFDMYRL